MGTARDSRDNVLVAYPGPAAAPVRRGGAAGARPALLPHHLPAPALHADHNRFTLAMNADFGYGNSYGGKPYPVFKNFYAGGIGSVRGFETASLGPVDEFGTPLGGTRKFAAQVEALTPLPAATGRCASSASRHRPGVGGGPEGHFRFAAHVHRHRHRLDLSSRTDEVQLCVPDQQRAGRQAPALPVQIGAGF